MPDVPSAFGEDAFGRHAEAAARFFGTCSIWRFRPRPLMPRPLILLAQTRQVDRDKAASDQLEAHREEVTKHMQEREAALKVETDELKSLLESNTQLTQQDKDLTEKIAALTREIHARLTAAST
jgi:hypothetical protein